MANNIATKNMSRDEWLILRRRHIGGSDIAPICGLSKWRSPVDVWFDKTGREKEKETTEAQRQGLDLEQYVAERFTEATGKKLRRVNYMLIDDDIPEFAANIDREVVGENAVFEAKTTSMFSVDEWADGNAPLAYVVQCQWYMSITGAEKAYLACVIFNREFVIREIERDDDIIATLRSRAKAFWTSYVEPDIMPPPNGSEASGNALKELYPVSVSDAPVIDLYGYSDDLKRYDEVSTLIDKMTVERDEIKQRIMLEMGESETAFCGARKVTWKSQNGRVSFNGKRLKEDHPDIYDEYAKQGTSFRVFKIFAPQNTEQEESK